ncbi:MAG: hypothetical protein AAGJ38_04910 [Planctomycetota bacterium]
MRTHKGAGLAYSTFDGKRVYFGLTDRPESAPRYAATIAEWLANGRQLAASPEDVTVTALAVNSLPLFERMRSWMPRVAISHDNAPACRRG